MIKSLAVLLAFIALSHGADVFCFFGQETPMPSCQFHNITPVTTANEEIKIIGQPLNYIDNATTGIEMDSNSIINFIPTNIFKIFPNLLSFHAYNVSVTTLTENSFDYCQNLKTIYLIMNSIFHVPAKFAKNCFALETMNLLNNKIKTIDEKAFEGLESLQFLYVSSNQITCIPPMLFQNTLGLQSIEITSNQITALHPEILKDLTLLQTANFATNKIKYIPNFNLARTGTLSTSLSIYLAANEIIAIDPCLLKTYHYEHILSHGISSLNIHFNPGENTKLPTCVDQSHPMNQMFFLISSSNWIQANVTFRHRTSCYKNWNEEMASNSLVTCGSVD